MKSISSGSSSDATPARISTKQVNDILDRLQFNKNRESTKQNYQTIWRLFNRFLIKLDKQPYKLGWEERVALFGAYMVDQGTQSFTLKSYFSAIKCILKADGHKWNDEKMVLSPLTRCCKTQNDTVKTRLPIHKRLLEVLLFQLE